MIMDDPYITTDVWVTIAIAYITTYLVGGIPTPVKNMKVNWDDENPNIWEKCSKPSTSYV